MLTWAKIVDVTFTEYEVCGKWFIVGVWRFDEDAEVRYQSYDCVIHTIGM